MKNVNPRRAQCRDAAAVIAAAVVAVASVLPLAAADPTPTAANMLDGLRALQSVASAGATYPEYSRRFLDLKIKADRYLAEHKLTAAEEKMPINQLKPGQRMVVYVGLAMFGYQSAYTDWSDWNDMSREARDLMAKARGDLSKQLAGDWKMASDAIIDVEKAEKELAGQKKGK